MSDEDGAGSSLNSTDTSRFLRELEALNSGPSDSSSAIVQSAEIGGSGDATITQLMNTMYNSQPKQKIVFTDREDEENNVGVYGREVDIFVTPFEDEDSPRAGSNKVKIKTVVHHLWDQRYYNGNLVAIHQDGGFVAFSVKKNMVRVMHTTTADRKLIKGFGGNVVDVAFAHSPEVMMAAVDDVGTLQVYACKLGPQGDIIHTPVLHVQLSKNKVCAYNRVVWCPYWPDETEDNEGNLNLQDSSKVLACIFEGQLDVLAVDMVTRDCGPGPIDLENIESGRISLVPTQEPIVEAVFSPDGSALASASMDGEVKFFQINWNLCGDKPECLHEWKPHDGQPLSFFAFLDDLKNMSPDAQFWKFAVTGCNKNQELKVWSCETWNCLQVIRFLAPPVGPELEPIVMKAGIDLSARYIILSDKTNMVLYVLQVYQDALTGRAHVSSIASFPLTQPCLSFAIIDASTKRFRTSLNDSHLDDITTGEVDQEEEEEEEEGGQGDNTADDPAGQAMIGVQIKLYAIHPRALETLVIHYRPESTVPMQGSAASLSQDTISLKDGLSDVSAVAETSFVESDGTVENVVVVEEENPPQPSVVSPDAFTKSVSSILVSPSAGANTTAEEVLSSTSSFTHVTGLTGHNAEDLLLSPASSADHSASAGPVLSPKSALETSLKSPLSPKGPGAILSPQSQGSALSPTSTLSPKSPKFSTPHEVGGSGELTPSTVPLPPEEEGELATPQDSYISEDGSQLEALEAFFKPSASSSSSQPQAETSINTGTFDVDTLSKESPAAVAAPAPATAPTAAAAAAVQGPSATTDAYDENDQEVAEVLGEDMDQSYSSTGSGGGVTAPADYSAPHAEEEEDRPHKPWPRPPDVPASEQSVSALAPPLPQALDEAIITQETGDRDDDDDDDDNSEDQNEAEVEEEIEEVLEEADDDDDNDEEEEEGEDFRKTYREVERGRGQVKVIKEVMDPSVLAQLQESIMNLGMEVSRQHEHLCRLQQQMAEQHHLQVDLQRQQLEQASMRSAAQPSKDLEQQLGRVQNVVASRVERALLTTLQKETRLLHDRLTSSDTRQTTYMDSLQKSVTHTVTTSVHKAMDTVVKNEFKHTISPSMARATDQMKNQLHSDTAQKLAAMETVVKDQIGKLVRSRAVTDAVSQGMSNAMFSHGEGLMRDLVDKRIIPSFSQSVDVMITQINAIFQSGTTEYVNHLKKQIDKVRQEQESGRDPLIQQLQGLVDNFQRHSHHITSQLAQVVSHEVSHQIKTSLSGFQEQLMSGVRAAVREEVSSALREQGTKMTDSLASYLRSGAGTPVPGAMPPDTPTMLSPQDQVKQLVSRRRFDKAFQMALSASNLDLVVYVCDLVDPAEVFGTTPCLLSQPVLLSLIQQLSAELASSFSTKVRYLTEAVTILDSNDAVTQEHIPVVLEGLASKLRTYMASHPPSRDIRLLLMATNSLLATASAPTQ